jgi:hypothetical protein
MIEWERTAAVTRDTSMHAGLLLHTPGQRERVLDEG